MLQNNNSLDPLLHIKFFHEVIQIRKRGNVNHTNSTETNQFKIYIYYQKRNQKRKEKNQKKK